MTESRRRAGGIRIGRSGAAVMLLLGTGAFCATALRASAAAGGMASVQATATGADGSQQSAPTPPLFGEWLAGVRTEALAHGIRPEIVDEALATVEEPVQSVIERDRSQAEIVLPLEEYVSRRLTAKVIKSGRDLFERHRVLLEQIEARYNVPPAIIVAVWGLESNYGRFSGVRPTIAALATLAWDPRRATFFRAELMDALEILNQGDVDVSRMRGSWAGAMGQVQFMPSSYLAYAEDFDGDGRRDIWSSPGDVFASIANYLKGHGWTDCDSWGREVRVSPEAARRIAVDVNRRSGTCQATREMTVALPMTEWRRLGVLQKNGRPLPGAAGDASLVSGRTRAFLVQPNYDALLEYNCAHSYALSVGLLADCLGRRTAPPRRPAVHPAVPSDQQGALAGETTRAP